MGLRPVLNCLDLLQKHSETRRQKLVAEVLSRVSDPFTFCRFDIKFMLMKLTENISNMLLVGGLVHGVDKDIVQVD